MFKKIIKTIALVASAYVIMILDSAHKDNIALNQSVSDIIPDTFTDSALIGLVIGISILLMGIIAAIVLLSIRLKKINQEESNITTSVVDIESALNQDNIVDTECDKKPNKSKKKALVSQAVTSEKLADNLDEINLEIASTLDNTTFVSEKDSNQEKENSKKDKETKEDKDFIADAEPMQELEPKSQASTNQPNEKADTKPKADTTTKTVTEPKPKTDTSTKTAAEPKPNTSTKKAAEPKPKASTAKPKQAPKKSVDKK